MQGGFTADYDETSGIVKVVGHGFWARDAIIEHFADLEKLVARVRARNGFVRAMIDLRAAPVQSTEISDIIRDATRRIYVENDRIAIVRTSRLLDLQLRRAVEVSPLRTFATVEEAVAWLDSAAE